MSVTPSQAQHTAASHWEYSYAPFVLTFGIFFLVPVAFTLYVVYHLALPAIISAGIGVPLLLWGIARWVVEGVTHKPLYPGLAAVGLPVFIIGEIFIFLGLFVSYWALRLLAPSWPPVGTPEISVTLPLFMTVVLVTSSYTIHVAEEKFEHGDMGGFKSWLWLTVLLAVVFMGCTGFEYNHLAHEGFVPATNIFSSIFYTITGFHGSHVLVGAGTFVAIGLAAANGMTNATLLKCGAVYWHFVDLVWFFVVSQVYFW